MTIVIGFSRARSVWAVGSKIIAKTEKRPYSHVYIRNSDLETGLEMVYQASHGYVNAITYSNFKLDNIVVKEYALVTDMNMYLDTLCFIKRRLGIPYSRMQLILIGIKKLLHFEVNIRNGEHAEICSELGERVANHLGIKPTVDFDYVTPKEVDHMLSVNNIPCVVY